MKKIAFILLGGILTGTLHAQENKGAENEAGKSAKKEIVVIVNSKSPLSGKITATKLKEIYLGNVKFERKVKLLPANQTGLEIFERFLKEFIDMTSTAYKTQWVKKIFSEGGSSPKVQSTPEDVVKYVSGNEGALGYLWESDLTGKEEGIIKLGIAVK